MNIQVYLDNFISDFRKGISSDQLDQKSLKSLFKDYDNIFNVTSDPVFTACGTPRYLILKNNIPIGFINIEPLNQDLGSNELIKKRVHRYRTSLYNFINTNLLEFQFYKNGELLKSVKIAEIQDNNLYSFPENFAQFIGGINDFCRYSGQMFISTINLAGILENWGISTERNDKIVNDYLKNNADNEKIDTINRIPRLKAFETFMERTTNSKTLCDFIWILDDNHCSELKIILGMGILEGLSSQVIGRQVHQYLKNPEALFRKSRDDKGSIIFRNSLIEKLPDNQLFKTASENATKIMASFVNESYLLADQKRWSTMEMIHAYRISKSGSHQTSDICDELEGIYPKKFVFTGWHWGCHCHITPEMSSEENFIAYLKGEKNLDKQQITEMPDNFIKYIEKNKEQISLMKQQPNWVKDNFVNGEIKKGLKLNNLK
jgi:hypothetical protein